MYWLFYCIQIKSPPLISGPSARYRGHVHAVVVPTHAIVYETRKKKKKGTGSKRIILFRLKHQLILLPCSPCFCNMQDKNFYVQDTINRQYLFNSLYKQKPNTLSRKHTESNQTSIRTSTDVYPVTCNATACFVRSIPASFLAKCEKQKCKYRGVEAKRTLTNNTYTHR